MRVENAETLRPHHGHQPVQAHHRDQKDGGVHVGAAEVIQDLAHGQTEVPAPLDEVDDEKRREHHEHAVCAGQVKDKRAGDRAATHSSHDAPDDEEVTGNAQDEGDTKDQSSCYGCSVAGYDSRGGGGGGQRGLWGG